MQNNLVTVFGGSGFVGTQLVQELAKAGYRIRVAVRRPDLAQHLRPLGDVGQIALIQANVRNLESVERAVAGAGIVINLVAIKSEAGRQRFRAVNTMGAGNVARAAAKAGAGTFVQFSTIGADRASDSFGARSRGLGEAEVLAAFPGAVILRSSLIFGTDDNLFNLFGGLARLSPILPVVGAQSRFQPVYVGDVAQAAAQAAAGLLKGGEIYELGGPEIISMHELMAIVLKQSGRSNLLLPLPLGIAKLVGFFLQLLPSPLLTVDQVVQLQHDNVVSEEARKARRTLQGIGIIPTAMEVVLPTYMWRFRKHGQFEDIAA